MSMEITDLKLEMRAMMNECLEKGEDKICSITDKQIKPVMRKCKKIEKLVKAQNKESNQEQIDSTSINTDFQMKAVMDECNKISKQLELQADVSNQHKVDLRNLSNKVQNCVQNYEEVKNHIGETTHNFAENLKGVNITEAKGVSSKAKESNSNLNEGKNIADNIVKMVLGSVFTCVSSKHVEDPRLLYTMTRKKII